MKSSDTLNRLETIFGERLQRDVFLSRFSTSRIGGPAEALIIIKTRDELIQAASILWENEEVFRVIGSGSNIVVSDKGFRGVILSNQAKAFEIQKHEEPIVVRAESGVNFSNLARRVGLDGYSGLEWASTIPGTLGGAVYGNAGAFGSDIHKDLVMAEILHRENGLQQWSNDQMLYGYRTSVLKRNPGMAVILSASLKLGSSSKEQVQAKMDELLTRRKKSQPPGASMGSTFKNPPGDHAGRLIEAAGLKGTRIGGAEISQVHANFFINHLDATAMDMKALIDLTKETVARKFGVQLELEVELVGDWDGDIVNFNKLGDSNAA